MSVAEVNFDGLVGPTHNYGGLSLGNKASMGNEDAVSNPREAALQGLAKMRALVERGFIQGFLPPHERPHLRTLRAFGFSGSDSDVLAGAAKANPMLLRNVSSSSNMWTANAATVAPSTDTEDGRVHMTPANLGAMFHRSIEHPFTERVLRTAFLDDRFMVHSAVPGGGEMGDEGAANHGRLAAEHGGEGLHLFVYGRSAFDKSAGTDFPARQAKEASDAVIRNHRLSERHTVLLQQAPEAIDAGAFHNDVVSVANASALLYHEDAFADWSRAKSDIERKAAALGFAPDFVCVPRAAVTLEDAVSSYLFNSQLLTLPGGGMLLLLPQEAEANDRTRNWCAETVSSNGPIRETMFLDLRQSMRNGGGPACLRLRVVLNDDELAAAHKGFFVDEPRIAALEQWVRKHYRDRLTVADLGAPELLQEVRGALDELTQLCGFGSLYDFQRA